MRIENAKYEERGSVVFRAAARTFVALGCLVGVVAACGSPSPVESTGDHGDADLIVGSTGPGGGSLVMDYDFGEPFEVFEGMSSGGFTLWSGADPGFEQAESDEPDEGVYALADGVTISLEVTALEAGTQFRFGDVIVDEVGESVVLGTVPDFHGHGEWQLTLPDGVETGDYPFSFRFVADGTYAPSEPVTAFLTPVAGEQHDEHDHDDGHDDDDDDEHHDDDDDHDDHGADEHDGDLVG